MLKSTFAFVALALVAAPVLAEDAAPLDVKTGMSITSKDGAIIGRVTQIDRGADKKPVAVGIIYDYNMIHIPVSTLTAAPRGAVTSLTRKEVGMLH